MVFEPAAVEGVGLVVGGGEGDGALEVGFGVGGGRGGQDLACGGFVGDGAFDDAEVDFEGGVVGGVGEGAGKVREGGGVGTDGHLGEAVVHEAAAVVGGLENVVLPEGLFAEPDAVAEVGAVGVGEQDERGEDDGGAAEGGELFDEKPGGPDCGEDQPREGEEHAVVVFDLGEWVEGGGELRDNEPEEAEGDGVEARAGGGVGDGRDEEGEEEEAGEDGGGYAVDWREVGVDVEVDGEEKLAEVAEPDVGLGEAVVGGRDEGGEEGFRGHRRLEPEREDDKGGGGKSGGEAVAEALCVEKSPAGAKKKTKQKSRMGKTAAGGLESRATMRGTR